MPKRKQKGEREPRPPTATTDLPATFAEAEEAEIIGALERWFPRIADKLTAEYWARRWALVGLCRNQRTGLSPLSYPT